MHSYTDEQLMHIFKQDKENQGSLALDYLYQRYARKLLGFFYFSLKRDYSKAQDFVHDVFVKLIENHQKFDTNQSFKPWIYRVATNMCKNEIRSAVVASKYHHHVQTTLTSTDFQEDFKDFLKTCIDELSAEQRSLIVLRFKLKLSVKEIADIYECPEGTIKSRLFYTIKELTKIYNQ